MRVLLYLVLMLASLLGGTAQVFASDERLAEKVLDQLPGSDHCLNDHGLIPDLPPLPGDNEPRLLANETVIEVPYHSSPVETVGAGAHAASVVSLYPIRAPPSRLV
ncbi:hypothetical protein ADIMK_3113 [Marinobacterium lacunae]|uniref:Uncharacterized protein n=1 Tax=Marinobacterium lacunae TaxID=1232683 RepID=A0A081FVT6_9GAMM|nr:hypothetical protein [Marinobacterium lacunae]KEA62641.1 hypothetical protein ADIMK_3113 [Marinobacterium lacunae]MBR9883281.1 hypothetical protein [Oceanospirillales bacterium]